MKLTLWIYNFFSTENLTSSEWKQFVSKVIIKYDIAINLSFYQIRNVEYIIWEPKSCNHKK